MAVVLIFLTGWTAGGFLNAFIEYKQRSLEAVDYREADPGADLEGMIWLGGIYPGKPVKICWSHLVIIIINALGWVAVVLRSGFNSNGWAGLFLFSLCLVITVIDLRHYLIPDGLVLIMFLGGIVYHCFCFTYSNMLNCLLGAVTGFLILLMLSVLSGGGIGGGDIKLLTAMGFWLGLPGILYALCSGALTAGVCGLALLVSRRKKLKDTLPFGPFLTAGFLIVFICLNV